MGQNEISFCLATSNFSAGDHDMVFRSWKMQTAGSLGSRVLCLLWVKSQSVRGGRARWCCSGVPTLLSFSRGQERRVWHSHWCLAAGSVEEKYLKFESLTALDVAVCLPQELDLSVKLWRTWFILPFAESFIFPGKCFQPWVCWWTLATMSVLQPQALGGVGWSGAAELWPTVPTALEITKGYLQWDHVSWAQWTILNGLISIRKALIIYCSWS